MSPIDRFLPLFYLIGWFGSIFVASYLINWLLIRSVIRKWYRFFVAPGVVVHELSHAVGCLATGSQITEINFWKASGGHVKHLQTNDPLKRVVADPIIALAPIGGTFVVLALLTIVMIPNLFQTFTQGDYTMVTEAIDITRWETWLYLYLTTSLLATIAPSKTDMRYALASLIIISIVLVVLVFIPGVSELILGFEQQLQPFAVFTLVLLCLGVIISFFLAIPYRKKHFVPKEQID